MTSPASPEKPEGGFLGLLHAAALIAVPAGAVGSVGLLLRAGQRNNSRLLLVLFTIWVLSPFVALASANVISKRWSVVTRGALYSLMLVLPLGSVAIYATGAFKPARSGAVFLFVAPSPSVMAADCHRCPDSRVHIRPAVPPVPVTLHSFFDAYLKGAGVSRLKISCALYPEIQVLE